MGVLYVAGILVVDECTARGTVFTIGPGVPVTPSDTAAKRPRYGPKDTVP